MNDFHLRLENHWLACMASAGGGAPVSRTLGGLVVVNPAVAGYAFNFMALRAVEPARLATATELGGALLAGGERPPAVFLSPAAGDQAQLGAGLMALGWRPLLRQSVLVRELTALPPCATGVRVEAVGPDQVPGWGRLLAEAYEVDPLTGEALAEAWGAMLTGSDAGWRATGYLATVGEVPAGTGLLWSQGEIAGLYCGAVLPHMRRQGVHRATVLRRLADAAGAGCHWAVLQTEAGSPVESLCTRELGFTVAYNRELWIPESAGYPRTL
ncbi:MAG TPA: hypothetical protein VNT75_29780 [Symbiobacteriaceae bacterium]|nr:hypothetical protein [Symbiobacteriaceae bacterium]